MPERARVSLGLSGASGALQLGAWALFFLPFATLSVAVADPAGPGDLTAASRRDPGYLPWAIGAMLVTGVASAAGAVALAMWGVARGAPTCWPPRATARSSAAASAPRTWRA